MAFNCQMHEVDAFEKQVSAYPAVSMIRRASGDTRVVCDSSFQAESCRELLGKVESGGKSGFGLGYVMFTEGDDDDDLNGLPTLEEAGVKLGIGIATGKDKVFVTDDPDIVEHDRLMPLAYAKDVANFSFPDPPSKWLVNPWDNGNLVNLDDYPRLKSYFLENREDLAGRHVASKEGGVWFRTIDKVKAGLLEREKLLIRDMSNSPEPIYESGKLYPHHNLYWMVSDCWDLKVLGGILISEQVNEMMDKASVRMRGGVMRNQAQYLRQIRVPKYESISPEDRHALSEAFDARDKAMASEVCARLYA